MSNINPLTGLPIGDASKAYKKTTANDPIERRVTRPADDVFTYEGTDSFDSYGRYGVIPTPFNDLDERRAERQSTGEKFVRGISKFAGKTTTAVLGSTVGTLYGVGASIINGSLSSFYDNAFQRGLDDINEWMDEKAPLYRQRYEEDLNFWQSLGTANFWLDDFSNAVSFTVGAVLSELLISATVPLTGGSTAPLAVANAANILSRAKVLLKGFGKGARATQKWNAARVGRQIITGAGYEAGVEARHFRDQAIEQYKAQNPNATPEEMQEALDNITSKANMVFGANLALVGASNALQFKKIFGPGIKTNANVGFSKGITKKSGDFVEGTFEAAHKSHSKLLKGMDVGYRVVRNPVMEGIVEEGGQSVISNTALNYLAKGYSEEGAKANYSVIDAITESLAETYGTKEGWKEIGIGMLVGSMGSPTFRKAPWAKGGWSGGIAEEIGEFKANKQEQEDLASRNTTGWTYDNIRNMIKANNEMYESEREQELAFQNGDIFAAKSAEEDALFGFLSARAEADLLGATVDDMVSKVQGMSTEDFRTEFGYTGTDEEVNNRKADVIRNFKEKAKDVTNSWKKAKAIKPGEDYSDETQNNIQRGIAHSIYTLKSLDRREEQILNDLRKEVENVDPNLIKQWVNDKYGSSTKAYKGHATRLKNSLDAIQHMAKNAWLEYRKAIKNNPKSVKLEKKIKDLQEKINSFEDIVSIEDQQSISRLEEQYDKVVQEYNELLPELSERTTDLKSNEKDTAKKYNEAVNKYEEALNKQKDLLANERANLIKQTDSFDTTLEDVNSVVDRMRAYENEIKKLKDNITPINKEEINRIITDLNRIMQQKTYTSGAYNSLLSKKGQDQVDELTKRAIQMYEGLGGAETIGKVLRDSNTTVEDVVKDKINTKAEELNNELNNVQDEEFKKMWDSFKEQEKGLTNKSISAKIEFYAQWADDFSPDTNPQIGALTEELQKPYKDAVLYASNKILQLAEQETLEKERNETLNSKPYNAVVERPLYLNNIIKKNLSPQMSGWLSNKDWKFFNDFGILSVDEYALGEENRDDTPFRKKDWHEKISVVNGHMGLENAAVHLWVRDVDGTIPKDHGTATKKIDGETYYLVGNYPDPRRFVSPTGEILDMSKPENLAKVNPNFVTKGKMNTEGGKFYSRWKTTVDLFEEHLDELGKTIKLGKVARTDANSSFEKLDYVPFDQRPTIDQVMATTSYDIEIEGVGKGIFVLERDKFNKDSVGDRIFMRKDGKWEQLTGAKYNKVRDYAHAQKTKKGTRKFGFAGGSQYALMAEHQYQNNRATNFYDLGKAEYTKVERDGLMASVIKQLNTHANTVDAKPTRVLDQNGDPIFIALKSKKFLSNSEPVKAYLATDKYGDETMLKVTLLYNGQFYSSRLGSKEEVSKMKYQDFIDRIEQMINEPSSRSKIYKLKSTHFDDLTFSRIQKQVDKTPENVGELLMNAIPTFSLYVTPNDNSKFYKTLSGLTKYEPKPVTRKKPPVGKPPKTGTTSDGQRTFEGGPIGLATLLKISKEIQLNTSLLQGVNEINDANQKIVNDALEFLNTLEANNVSDSFSSFKKLKNTYSQFVNALTTAQAVLSGITIDEEVDSVTETETPPTPTDKENPFGLERGGDESKDTSRNLLGGKPKAPKAPGEDTLDQGAIDKAKEIFGDEELPFRVENEFYNEEPTSLDEKIDQLSKILPIKSESNPDGFTIKELETLATNGIPNGTLGFVANSLVALSNKSGDKTAYHEAFHAVFRNFLTTEEIHKLYKNARTKWGRPTISDLVALRNRTKAYNNLSTVQLTSLFYEEKMADAFMEYAYSRKKAKESWLSKLINKILRWIKAMRNKQTLMDAVFADMYNGKYVNSKPLGIFNEVFALPAFAIIKTKNRDGFRIKEGTFGVLNKEKTNSIIFGVINSVLKKGDNSERSIREELERLRTEYYDAVVWKEELKAYAEKYGKAKAYTKMIEIHTIHEALANENNINNIVDDILSRMEFWELTPIDIVHIEDLTEQDFEANSENDFDSFDQAIYEVGGPASISQFMKNYIMTTTTFVDEFGLLEEPDVNNDKYQRTINSDKVYYGIARTLVNQESEAMLNVFRNFKKGNENASAFYDRLISDIASQLGLSISEIDELASNPELTQEQYNVLSDSIYFNQFIRAFKNDQVDFYSVLYDKERGEAKSFSSNRVGVDKVQIEEWRGAFEAKAFTKNEVNEVIDSAKELFESEDVIVQKDSNGNLKYIEEHAADIAIKLNEIGISISPHYIKWSLLDYHKDLWQEWNEVDEYRDTFEEWTEFYSSFKTDPLYVAHEVNKNLFNVLKRLNNASSLSPTNTSGFFVREERNGVIDRATGAESILRKIAKANSKFDENVGESTFRNAENRQVYNKIRPTLFSTFFRRLRKEGVINADNVQDIIRIYNEIETQYYLDAISNNSILKGLTNVVTSTGTSFTEDSDFAEFVVSNMDVVLADGIREESFSESGELQTWKQSQGGKTYKALNAESKELFKLLLFANSGIQNNDINYKGRNIDFRYFKITNSEKSTQLFVRMPVVDNVTTDISFNQETNQIEGSLSPYSKEVLYNSVKTEFDRIKKTIHEIYLIKTGQRTSHISEQYHGNQQVWDVFEFNDNGKLINPKEVWDYLSKMKYPPKGLKLFLFQNYPLTESIEQAAISDRSLSHLKDDIGDAYSDFLLNEFNTYLKEVLLNADMIGLDLNNEDQLVGYVNNILPKDTFGRPGETLNLNAVAKYFFNQTLYGHSVNELLHGNYALSYTSLDNVVKRNGGLIAAGPVTSNGEVRYKTQKTRKMDVDELSTIRHGLKASGVDRTDAQTFGNIRYYLNHYLKLLGKAPRSVRNIMTKLERGLDLVNPLTREEIDILTKNNATLTDRKIVGRSITWYNKTSLHTITWGQVAKLSQSFISSYPNLEKEINKRYNKYEKNPTRDNAERIIEMYQPLKGKEVRFNILADMYRDNYDLNIYDSGSKMTKFDVGETLEESQVHSVHGEAIKEQQQTDNIKTKVVHGTQMMQLIWSEHDPDSTVTWQGKEVKLRTLVSAYKNTLAERVKRKGIDLSNTIFQFGRDGNLTPDAFKELMRAVESGSITDDIWLTEILFEKDSTGMPKYDYNYPAIRFKFEAIYLAYVSERVFKNRVPGAKYTLVSDYGYELPREVKQTITKEEAMALAEQGAHVIEKNGKFYELGEVSNKKTGTITSRLQHRIKDTDRFGNDIWVSEAIVSEAIIRRYGFKKGDIIPKDIAIQMGIRIPTQDKHSMVAIKIVDVLPEYYTSSIMLPYEIIELSGADFDIDSLFTRMYAIAGNNKAYGSYYQTHDPYNTALEEYISANGPIKYQTFINMTIQGKPIKTVIKENVEYFKNGDIDKIIPITIAELENLLLDIELRLVHSNKEIAATPATMSYLKDTLKKFQEQGVNMKGAIAGLYTPLDQYKIDKALEIGDRGIGVSAVFNTLFQKLIQLDAASEVPIFKDYDSLSDFMTSFEGRSVRKNDVFSAIISAMTDNANEKLASEFNLTTDTLGPAMYMIGVGMPVEDVFLYMRQPVISEFIKHMNRENNPIKLDDRDSDYSQAIDEMGLTIQGLDTKTLRALSYVLYELQDIKYDVDTELNEQVLFEAIKKFESNEEVMGFDALNEEELISQKYILNEFIKAKQISEEYRAYRLISSKIKGLETSWYSVERIFDSLDKLGLRITLKKNKSGLEASHWNIAQRMKTGENGKSIPDNITGTNYHDLLKAFPLDLENLKATRAQLEGSKHYFILQSERVRMIREVAMNNFNPNHWKYSENIKQVENSLLSFLLSKSFRKKKKPSITPEKLFEYELGENNEKVNPIHERVKALRETERFANNDFFKAIRLNQRTYKSKNSPFRGMTMFTMELETNFSADISRQDSLIRGFMDLYYAAETNRIEREKNGIKALSLEEKVYWDAVSYLLVKDGLLFKNQSFIRSIAPFIISDAFTSLKDMRVLFSNPKSNLTYNQVFGTEFVNLIKEFEETYSRWSVSSYNLKYLPNKGIRKKNVRLAGMYTESDVKDSKYIKEGHLFINLYAGLSEKDELGNKKGKEAVSENFKEFRKFNLTSTTGEELGKMLGNSQLLMPRFIKRRGKNKKDIVYRLEQQGVLINGKKVMLDNNGRIIFWQDKPSFKFKHLNYAVQAGEISQELADTIRVYGVGYYGRYAPVKRIGNNDMSPFGSGLKAHEKLMEQIEETEEVGGEEARVNLMDYLRQKQAERAAAENTSVTESSLNQSLPEKMPSFQEVKRRLANLKKGDTFTMSILGEQVQVIMKHDMKLNIAGSKMLSPRFYFNSDTLSFDNLELSDVVEYATAAMRYFNQEPSEAANYVEVMEEINLQIPSEEDKAMKDIDCKKSK
jgi:hypothetical protein